MPLFEVRVRRRYTKVLRFDIEAASVDEAVAKWSNQPDMVPDYIEDEDIEDDADEVIAVVEE